jgi:hypothetical protein
LWLYPFQSPLLGFFWSRVLFVCDCSFGRIVDVLLVTCYLTKRKKEKGESIQFRNGINLVMNYFFFFPFTFLD